MFIDHSELQTVLRSALDSTRFLQQFESEIDKITETDQRVTLTLKSGEEVTTDLLVVAEGSGSELAGELGITRQGWSHNQRALVVNLQR